MVYLQRGGPGGTLGSMKRPTRGVTFAASLCVATLAAASLSRPAAAQRAADSLRSRVGPPDEVVLKAYVDSGVPNPTPHELTDAEWVKVEAAWKSLPELHRRVLEQHLRRLSFVNVPPGGGNALTRDVDPKSAHKQFDITLRAGILQETLTEFLNGKESGVFEPDASGQTVTIEAGDTSALLYILLHEATHAVDATLGISASPKSPFAAGIWLDRTRLASPYDRSLINATTFRRGAKTQAAKAQALYQALSRTPFVSLYATAAAPEDLAELVAWEQLSTQLQQPLVIVVKDSGGRVVYRYEPLKSSLVRRRFSAVKELLARRAG
jgi:hypothetical protein